MSDRQRIIVLTGDTLGARMAGPGLRALALADALAREHDVRLLTTGTCELPDPGFPTGAVAPGALEAQVEWCEVLVVQGWVLAGQPWVARCTKVVVCDLYDPMHLEQLEQGRDGGPDAWRRAVHGAMAALNDQVRRGDYFLCASEKQRDFWLGHLAGLGRVNPATYQADTSLRGLIDVVPFGTSDRPPERRGPALRGVLPGVDDRSQILLWGGGVYNWFDPLTLIRAVDRLRHDHPHLRLVFMGMQHPSPKIPHMRMAADAQALAAELGLTDHTVFFNEGWVPFEQRQDVLLDADIGVSTHFDHVETAFAFRTRVLDYLWAGLPVVTTGGDTMAELVRVQEAGLVVPPRDVEALVAALGALLGDPERTARCAGASRAAGETLRWSVVVEPLLRFCRAPHRAPDLVDAEQQALAVDDLVVLTTARSHLRHDLLTARRFLAEEGLVGLLRHAGRRVRRLTRRR